MSKKSRTFQPPPTSGRHRHGEPRPRRPPEPRRTTAAHRSPPSPCTQRTCHVARGSPSLGRGQRPRQRAAHVFERYRALIIGVIAVVLVGGAVAYRRQPELHERQCLRVHHAADPRPHRPDPDAATRDARALRGTRPRARHRVPARRRPRHPSRSRPSGSASPTADLGGAMSTTSHQGRLRLLPAGQRPALQPRWRRRAARAPVLPADAPRSCPATGSTTWSTATWSCCTGASRRPRSSSSCRTSWPRRHPARSHANDCGYNKVIAVRFDDMDSGRQLRCRGLGPGAAAPGVRQGSAADVRQPVAGRPADTRSGLC